MVFTRLSINPTVTAQMGKLSTKLSSEPDQLSPEPLSSGNCGGGFLALLALGVTS